MPRVLLLLTVLLAFGTARAQSLSPQVLGNSGAVAGGGPTTLSWTIGEPLTTSLVAPSTTLTQGFHQTEPLRVRIRVSAFLEGAYDSGSGLMRDELRAGTLSVGYPLIPGAHPFAVAPWSYAGGEVVLPGVFAVSGPDAIVDWVLVELRDPIAPAVIIARRAGLVQRDGDVVDMDGTAPLSFPGLPGGVFHVAVRHRNHLGVMTATALTLGPAPTDLDLTTSATATYGTYARKTISGAFPAEALWMGNSRPDDRLKYTGTNNDRDPILVRIGGSVPTNIVNGYYLEDNTLDGRVKYTGSGNDRDPILLALPGNVTSTRPEQLPTP